ncbi:MAG TPA: hypothetical protein VG817_10930 [Gemmatimonadales bacterium]|nr:hypothetical protein [Gemmatimonadales bacterium]
MTWLSLVAAGAVVGVAAWSGDPKPVDPRCERLLPVAVADRLAGHTDLALYGRGAIPAGGGTCNYATAVKKMVFLVSLIDMKSRAAADFDRKKADPAYTANQHELAGVGDEAFTGGSNEHLLVARKGSVIVSVAAMVTMDRATHRMHATLTRDQLVAIGKQVVAGL